MKKNAFQDELEKRLTKFKINTAIEYKNRSITYGEIDRRANGVANWILNKGIKKGSLIGILTGDRLEFILAIIGILRAGCVFVPLDTNNPVDRLCVLINTVGLRYIFCDKTNFDKFTPGLVANTLKEPVEFIVGAGSYLNEEIAGNVNKPLVTYRGDDPVYVYFTSGTSRMPKAVLGKNIGLLHFIAWEIDTFGIDETFRVSQFTTTGFDAFLRDLFVPLFSGGTLCIPDDGIMSNGAEFIDWIDKAAIDVIHCVPSVFRLIDTTLLTPGHFKKLKYIMLSGERIDVSNLVNWYNIFDRRIQLVNFYGPTETTMIKSYYMIQKSDVEKENIPIGKPIRGTRLIVCNEKMEMCDELIKGEIYIRTPYMTLGYCNDIDLNKERFIKNPFTGKPGDILYKTGDIGRFLLDGNIEFLGRVDRQVKIRGVRIELEEIENLVIKNAAVKEAVVLKKETPGHDDFLCAYVTRYETNRQDENLFSDDLMAGLKKILPDYMVPTKIIIVAEMPRLPNGKVDINALPDPLEVTEAEFIPAGNDVEKKLVELWSGILGIEEMKISIKEPFFSLGGNSLNVMALLAKIQREFNVLFTLGEIFKKNTVEMQAEFIMSSRESKYEAIVPLEKKEYYEVSFAQRRIWVLGHIKGASVAFNMPMAFSIEGELNREAFINAFKTLVERHESLRTVFIPEAGEIKQKILAVQDIPFKLESFDIRELQGEERESKALELAAVKSNSPFDLSTGPMFRIGLVRLEDMKYLFLFNIHHIIADYVSMDILIREIFILYAAHREAGSNPLKPLRIHYKDYAAWQNSRLTGKYLEEHRRYWLNCFKDIPPMAELPLDRPRPAVQSYKGGHVEFKVMEPVRQALKNLGEQNGVTLFMTLLSALGVLLYYYTGQDDIVIGAPIADREHVDLENQIGLCLNTIAMRIRLEAEEPFSQLLEKVKRVTRDAMEHQLYPFDMLVEDLALKRETGRTPLFDVMIDMLNLTSPRKPGINSDLKITPFKTGWETAKFDLTFYIAEGKDTLGIKLEYNADIFEHETVKSIAERCRVLLNEITKNPQTIISEIHLEETLDVPTIGSISREKYLRG
jgi:amino acid adenylation domain-containing protein